MDKDKRALQLMEEGLNLILQGLKYLSDIAPNEEGEVVFNDYKEKKCLSKEEVKRLLVEKTRQGKGERVRKLLNSFGVDKLSDLPQEKYEEVCKQAKEL